MIKKSLQMYNECKNYFEHQIFNSYTKPEANKDSNKVLILLPGFITNEKPLKSIIVLAQKMNFNVISLQDILNDNKNFGFLWRKGFNMGWNYDVLKTIDLYIEDLNSQNKEVSVVGWSLGGFYARMLTQEVKHVINISSPVYEGIESNCSISWLYQLITGKNIKELDIVMMLSKTLNKHEIINYSALEDGLLTPSICINTESVNIKDSHINILHNAELLDGLHGVLSN